MKKAVAAMLIGLAIFESPSCGGSKGGGSGDANHPNVRPLNPPVPSKVPNPGSVPSINGDNPREITFQATWEPDRPMVLTWKVNGTGATVRENEGFYNHDVLAKRGDLAEFQVENMGVGGDTSCAIYVNGLLYAPRGADFQPFNEVSGGSDCRTIVLVP